jgi:hypothetical protein
MDGSDKAIVFCLERIYLVAFCISLYNVSDVKPNPILENKLPT